MFAGLVILAFILIFTSLIKSEKGDDNNNFAIVARFFANKEIKWIARSATVVFGLYTLAVVLLVMGTGGTSGSPFSSILMLGASFGYTLAFSKKVKQAVILAPNIFYIFLLFIYANNEYFICIDCNQFLIKIELIFVMVLVGFMTWKSPERNKGGQGVVDSTASTETDNTQNNSESLKKVETHSQEELA